MSTTRAAGFIVYRRISDSIEYLLLQTSYGKHHWTPPKGHCDPGEDDLTTAFRETQEEAGFEKSSLTVHDLRFELSYPAWGKSKTVVYWLALLSDNNEEVKLSNEHQAFKWLSFEGACNLSHDNFKGILTQCNDFLIS